MAVGAVADTGISAAAAIIGAIVGAGIVGRVALLAERRRQDFERHAERAHERVALQAAVALVLDDLRGFKQYLESQDPSIGSPLDLPSLAWSDARQVLAGRVSKSTWKALARCFASMQRLVEFNRWRFSIWTRPIVGARLARKINAEQRSEELVLRQRALVDDAIELLEDETSRVESSPTPPSNAAPLDNTATWLTPERVAILFLFAATALGLVLVRLNVMSVELAQQIGAPMVIGGAIVVLLTFLARTEAGLGPAARYAEAVAVVALLVGAVFSEADHETLAADIALWVVLALAFWYFWVALRRAQSKFTP